MNHLNRPKYVTIGILSLIYLLCGFYIGCDQNKDKKKTTPPAAPKDTASSTASPSSSKESESAKDSDSDDKGGKGSSSDDEDSGDDEDLDDDSSGSSSGSKSTKSSVSLKFTSATKLRAFCSIPSSDLLKLVKSLDGVSSSELKEIAGTKIGKVLTYNQLKDLKTMAGDIKLSHINSLKSQMCKNEDTNAGEEEDEEVEDEG